MDQPPRSQVNLLHPLATLEWRECCEMPVSVYIAQAVVLGNKVYIGGGFMYPEPSSRLLVYDFAKDLWQILDTPTEDYALTIYHSQLVLVGGVDPQTKRVAKKLWVLDKQCHWTQPLPPMTTKRCHASAVSVGDHLIVAGGHCGGHFLDSDADSPDSDVGALDTVEVYDGSRWRQVQSLPRACWCMKSILHEGNWYLAGGMGQDSEVYHTSLRSLIATSDVIGQTLVWEKLPDTPLKWPTLTVLGNHLITVGGGYPYSSAIHAYSTSFSYWVHVGDLPVASDFTCTLVLPTGELLVLGGNTESRPSCSSFKAVIKATSFLGGYFNMSSLDRLEKVAGIFIFNKLAPRFLNMASALHFDESILDSLRKENDPVEGSKAMVKFWLSGKSFLPPTWQVLLENLQSFGMGELAQEIEHFFNRTSVTSPSASQISDEEKEDLELDVSEIERKEMQTKPDCSDMAVQTLCEATAAESTGYLRGVDVIAETSVLFTNQAQSFHWSGYGLKLHIPQNVLPAGLEECRLFIKVGLSGQFALPKNTSLVSAVYWLDSEPRCKFTQLLTLEVQHCVKSTHTSKLSFVHAKCSQMHLPYEFIAMEKGVFSSDSAYGCVQLKHFSLLGIVCNPFPLVGLFYNAVSEAQLYRASLYYLRKEVNRIDIHVVIIKDQEPHTTFVKQKYATDGATIGPNLRVEFESSSISLELPSKELILNGGWKIIPLIPPKITKEDVDSFETRQEIPSCQLTAVWTTPNKPSQLIHEIPLEGTKKPSFFSIILDCDYTPQRSTESIREVVRHQPTQDPYGRSAEFSLASIPDLKDLMTALYRKVADKWKVIGVHLEISDLASIEARHRGDPHLCLLEMLDIWLKRVDPPPTWSAIIEAVEFLGEEQLGKELREKYCP